MPVESMAICPAGHRYLFIADIQPPCFICELAAERARAESLHQRLVALEDEKNTYMDYVGDALGQDHDRETLWDAAQRVLSDRDRLRAAIERALAELADTGTNYDTLRAALKEGQ